MQSNMNPTLLNIVPLIFFFGIIYFLMIRPQQRKQKAHQNMLTTLKKNDEVVTIGGVHATVINVKDKTFVIRVDDDTKVEIDKNAVSYVKKQRETN